MRWAKWFGHKLLASEGSNRQFPVMELRMKGRLRGFGLIESMFIRDARSRAPLKYNVNYIFMCSIDVDSFIYYKRVISSVSID